MKKIIFFNGKFIQEEEAKVSPLSPGFLYGWGLFETMRSYRSRIVYFNTHLQRLKNSCDLINITLPYPLEKLKNHLEQVVKINGLQDAYVRITLWRSQAGADVLIVAQPYRPFSKDKYKEGFHAGISRYRQNGDSFCVHLKTTNYLLYQLSYLEGKFKGFDEAVILNNRGYITEASRSNIFLVRAGEIITPPLASGCLSGITRRVIFDLARKYRIKIYENNLTIIDAEDAQEAFLTNSLMGIMPLASIEKKAIGRKKRELTQFLQQKYNLLLE